MTFITTEIIDQQEALKDLPDEAKKAFETLANNRFKMEIDNATGVWHRSLEEDIKTLTGGKEKPQGKKSYQWLKEEWEARESEFQKLLKEAEQKGKSSKPESKELEELQKKLADYDALVKELKTKGESKTAELQQQLEEAKRGNLLLEVGFEKAQSLMGVEFDPLLDETVRNTFIESKWNELLKQYTPEKTTNDRGQTVTQWRDKEGKLLYNEANGHALMTTKDLLMKEVQPIVKKGRNQNGTGTNGTNAKNANAEVLDLQGAKTQVEADEIITNHLLSKGLQRGTQTFAQELHKIRTENKVQELSLM